MKRKFFNKAKLMIIQQLDRYSWPVITECQYENDLHIVTDREHMNEICNSKFAKGMQPFMIS